MGQGHREYSSKLALMCANSCPTQQILIGGRKANQLIERARKAKRCENENCAISFRPKDPDEPNSLRQQSVEHAGCAMGVCSGEDNRSIHDQLIIIEHRAQNDRLSSLSIVMIVIVY